MNNIWTPEEAAKTKLRNDAIRAEFDRLEGAVPYGLCFQFSLDTLRGLKTPEEARAFCNQWKKTYAVDRSDATNLHQ